MEVNVSASGDPGQQQLEQLLRQMHPPAQEPQPLKTPAAEPLHQEGITMFTMEVFTRTLYAYCTDQFVSSIQNTLLYRVGPEASLLTSKLRVHQKPSEQIRAFKSSNAGASSTDASKGENVLYNRGSATGLKLGGQSVKIIKNLL